MLRDAKDAHITLAEAQASAAKSLSTLPADQRKSLLDKFVQQASSEFEISDLASVAKAVGDRRDLVPLR